MGKQNNRKIFGLFAAAIIFSALCFGAAPKAGASSDLSAEINVSYDNELNSRTPDAVKSSSPYISVGKRTTYGDEIMRYIGKVDTSLVDGSREIEKAVIRIDRASGSWDGHGEYSLFKVNQDWNSSSATWNNQPEADLNVSAAGIFDGSNILEFDVTDLVNEWINNPDLNYGFLIGKSDESGIAGNEYGLFASADYPDAGAETKPYLFVSYVNNDPEITVLSPNGGGVWENGKTYNIFWSQSNVDKVTIFLLRGSTAYPVVYNYLVDINETEGGYEYTVPENIPEADDYKIWIIAYKTGYGQAQDYSDGYFTVRAETPDSEIKGDMDSDGDVDYVDFLIFYAACGSCEGDPEFNPEADFDQDGCVTFVDYQYFVAYYMEFYGF